MTAREIVDRDVAVRMRTEGDVDEEALAYLREKISTALVRPELPRVTGEVRITRAAAQHVALPWSAGADLQVGDTLVVVHAREATPTELADRLHDRLRHRAERAAHRRTEARRTATPPPWRGGTPQ
jgi:hypothetical protein